MRRLVGLLAALAVAVPVAASAAPGPLPNPIPDYTPPAPDDYAVPGVEPPYLSPGAHVPDLAPMPAWGVYVGHSVNAVTLGDYALDTAQRRDPFRGSRRAIRFGATIGNRGRHSLEVIGVARPTGNRDDPVRVEASQCVRFAGPRVGGGGRACQEYKPVGSLVYHPQHGHFHIEGFAQYRLLKDAGGKPDTSPAGVVSRSEKVGFCMADTDWLGRGMLLVDSGWYRECRVTAPNVPATFRQGLSPSWGDSYGPDLPGQHLVIDKVVDGVYWIAITVNPTDVPGAVNLFETSRANNTAYRRIKLSHGGTHVKAL